MTFHLFDESQKELPLQDSSFCSSSNIVLPDDGNPVRCPLGCPLVGNIRESQHHQETQFASLGNLELRFDFRKFPGQCYGNTVPDRTQSQAGGIELQVR